MTGIQENKLFLFYFMCPSDPKEMKSEMLQFGTVCFHITQRTHLQSLQIGILEKT